MRGWAGAVRAVVRAILWAALAWYAVTFMWLAFSRRESFDALQDSIVTPGLLVAIALQLLGRKPERRYLVLFSRVLLAVIGVWFVARGVVRMVAAGAPLERQDGLVRLHFVNALLGLAMLAGLWSLVREKA